MKKELLLPVGSWESLEMAIHNGADAVYLGGEKFGARAFAPNFTDEDLQRATLKCHFYDVKIYVTVNTMIMETELTEVLSYVDFLVKIKVDAIIVVDLGLINLIHQKYPDFELHLSTQAHTFSAAQMHFWQELGVKRIVVDRELSLKEIEALPDILDIELFIHGALCVCYSGQCYLSFMENGRSGNQGSCAQLCRMPYSLFYQGKKIETNGKYLLATKELNTSSRLQEIVNSKVKSLKIEGRMKSPEYVGFLARYYRNLLDMLSRQAEVKIDKDEEKKLKYLFNRDFTTGYLFMNTDIMNFKTSNHQGYIIGKVLEVNPQKIKIMLTEDLMQEDGIRFAESEKGMMINYLYNEKEKLIHEAQAGEIVNLDNKIDLQSKDTVRKTIDKKLMMELRTIKEKKIPLQMEVLITVPTVSLTIKDNHHTVTVKKDIGEVPINVSMTDILVKKQLLKLGNTPFCCDDITIHTNTPFFIPIVKLNELRRDGIALITKERMDL